MKQQVCPICKSIALYIFTSKHLKEIYECKNNECGHFHTPIVRSRMGIQEWSSEQLQNLENISEQEFDIIFPRDKRLLDLFLHQIDMKKQVVLLDYGAGSAAVSRSFKKILRENCVIYCLEPYEIYHEIYSKNGLLLLKSLTDLEDAIDLAYLIEVIEHIDDPISALIELRTKIKKGGLIFISTPIGKRTENEACSWAYDTESHVHFFTEKSLNLALISANLRPIMNQFYPEIYRSGPVPIWIQHARKWLSNAYHRIRGLKPNTGHLVGFTGPVD